jgi:hypothetical protein
LLSQCCRSVRGSLRSKLRRSGVKNRAVGVGGRGRGLPRQVPVQVGGDPDGGVPQHLRHDRERHAGAEHQRGGQVTQVVDAAVGQARLGGQGVEVPQQLLRADRQAVLPREHQAAVLVGLRPQRALGGLRGLLAAQRRDDPAGKADPGGAAAGLRGGEDEGPLMSDRVRRTCKTR